MASTNHHAEEKPRSGNGTKFDGYKEWLGFPKELLSTISHYAVLKVKESASRTQINAAAIQIKTLLRKQLAGPHAVAAQHILVNVEAVEAELLDEKRRLVYDIRLRTEGTHASNTPAGTALPETEDPARRDSELVVNDRTEQTWDEIAQHIPETVVRKRPQPGPLQRMYEGTKRHPFISGASAVVLAGAAGLFALRGREKTPAKPAATAQRQLPTNAPELRPSLPPPASAQPIESAPKPAAPTPPPTPEIPAAPPPPAPAREEEAPVPFPLPDVLPAEEHAVAPQKPAQPARSPAPTTEDLAPHRDLIQSPTLAEQTAQQLLEKAQQSRNHMEQWILLQLALKKARSDRDLDQVMAILSEMQKRFDIDDTVLQNSIAAVREAAQQKGGNIEQVMTHASGVIRSLCARGDFAGAKTFVSGLKDRPSANKKECTESLRVVTQLQKAYDEQGIAAHEETLASHPQDQEANRVVGTYRCFDLGDWACTSALRASGDPALQSIADRVERRAILPAADLLQLAKDLLAQRTPPGPGAVAMAMHCLELAEPKSDGLLLTARIKDQHADLTRRNASTLPFFRGEPLRPAAAALAAAHVSVDVPGTLPPGAVSLLGENLKTLLRRGHVVRARWEVAKEGETELLQGTSGYQSWIASLALPLSKEGQKIVQGGQYTCRFVFKRTGEGRREGGIQGATVFMIPLPNGRSIGIFWDGNMPQIVPGSYRSGFDPADTSFFGQRRDTTAFADHTRPVVTENGLEYVCIVTVRTTPAGFLMDAQIAGRDDRKSLGRLSLAAPPILKGAPYLFEEGDKRLPPQLGTPWGVGVGGGTVHLREAQIAPARPATGKPLGQVLPTQTHERRNLTRIIPTQARGRGQDAAFRNALQ